MDYMYRGVIDDHPETSQPTRKLDRYPQKIDRYGRYALLTAVTSSRYGRGLGRSGG